MNKIFKSKRVLFLTLILTCITFGITLISTYVEYKTAIETKKTSLIDDVNDERQFIKTLYDLGLSRDSILCVVKSFHQTMQSIGRSGEFVIAEYKGDSINFLRRKNYNGEVYSQELYKNVDIAAPIRMALEGKSGSIEGKDYRGVLVLAGITHSDELNWGLVAKIDIDEVNKPYINSLIISLLFTLTFTFIGAWLVIRVANPMIDEIIRSEENLSITLNSIGDGVITTDEHGLVTGLNPVAEHLSGWDSVSAKGKPIEEVFKIINAKTRKTVINPVKTVIEKGIIVGLANHTILISKNGNEYQIADSAAPIKNRENQIVGAVFTFSDVTEKYAAEENIRLSKKRLERAENVSRMGNWELHLDTKVMKASEGAAKLYGLTKESFDYDTVKVVPLPEYRQMIDEANIKLIENGDPYNIEFKIKNQLTGDIFDIHSLAEYDKEKKIMFGVIQDITERKLVENNLKESEEKFYKLFQSNPNANTIVRRSDGKFVEVNKSAEKLFGYNRNEMVGKTSAEIGLYVEVIERKAIWTTLQNLEYPNYHEVNFYTKDNNVILTKVSLAIITLQREESIIATYEDITERKRAEDELKKQNREIEAQYEEYMQLNEILRATNFDLEIAKEKAEESDQLKTAFLQNMSHEIRTPLNGIIGFSNLLCESELEKEEIEEYSSLIRKSGARLLETVNNVLDISRIETGQVKVQPENFSLNSLLDDLYAFFIPTAQSQGLELISHHFLENDNDVIYSDESKVNQILINLINNALKFTKVGKIDFGYEIKDSYIIFYIKDTGIGISKEMQTRIFERFMQAELSITRGYEGSGLGLSICQGLVELLGGEIWCESDSHSGSTFIFTIPFFQSQEIIKTAPSNKMKLNNKKIKILIAEDDNTSYLYFVNSLKRLNCELIRAKNGQEAVDIFKKTHDIDVVLMDIKMPIMNGIEATKEIRKMNAELPIIAQTAYAFKEEMDEIISSGCNDYLSKPFGHKELLDILDKYIKN